MKRPSGKKFVGGAAPMVDHAHRKMAFAARDRACELGLAVIKISPSHFRRSITIYVKLKDSSGRGWTLRVSNHHTPRRAPRPHVDIVSFDGLFGREQLLGFVDAIGAGTAPWFDPLDEHHRPNQRKMRRIARAY